MSKKIRFTALVAILLAVLTLNVALPVAADTGLPCYDQWRGCLAGGGGTNFCEGLWQGCMEKTYGDVAVASSLAT